VSTDIHLDSACRAGRCAESAARTRIRINYRSTLNPANPGQFVINSGGAEGTKPDTVKAGDTDRCLDDSDRSFDRLRGLRGRQIKNDFSRVSARDTDREVLRSLAFTKRGIPVVDLTGEVARTAGAAAAIGAVKRYFVAIFIKHMQNGPVRGYLEDVSGGRHPDAESCVLGGAHQYLLGAGRYCERYDPLGRRPSVVFSQIGATVRIHEIVKMTVG